MKTLAWLVAGCAAVWLVASPALAAHFEVVDQSARKEASPRSQPANGQVRVTVLNNVGVKVPPDFPGLSVWAESQVDVDSTEPACSDTFFANILVNASLMLSPDPGEEIGDPATVCVQFSSRQFANASSSFVAESTVSGQTLADPVSIKEAGNPVFTFGPQIITEDSAVKNFSQEVATHVGDMVTAVMSTDARVICDGVGQGHAHTIEHLSLSIGSCGGAAAAPAMDRGWLAALALLLGGLGAACLRRRTRSANAAG